MPRLCEDCKHCNTCLATDEPCASCSHEADKFELRPGLKLRDMVSGGRMDGSHVVYFLIFTMEDGSKNKFELVRGQDMSTFVAALKALGGK